MPFPQDTEFPVSVSLAAWNKARKGVKKDVKTGIGSKLKAYEAAWKAIDFNDLNPANLPEKPSLAAARLDKAKTAYPAVDKARKALKAASDLMLRQSTNTALDATSRKWLTTAVKTNLPPIAKKLADMDDVVDTFSFHYNQLMGPGGPGMQALHVRREWQAHQLKVDLALAEAALRLGKPTAWLVRLQGSDLVLSQRNGDNITHRELEPLIEDIKGPKKLGLSEGEALTETDIQAAKLVAKQETRSGTPNPVRDGRKAKNFQVSLNKNTKPTGEEENLLQMAHARQAWQAKGVLNVSTENAEAALMAASDGTWLLRKDGNKTMLSARKGGAVAHQDLEPLVNNRKWPKDVSLKTEKALDATKLKAALLAAQQLKGRDDFAKKLAALPNMPGYFAGMSAPAAEAKLANAAPGAWLVRSSSQTGQSAWTLKQPDGKLINYRIDSANAYDAFVQYARGQGRRLQVTQ